MKHTIVEQFLKIKEKNRKLEYAGQERRKEDDPAHFGHFCLEGLERRRSGSIFSLLLQP